LVDADVVVTAQALCDQLGLALERAQSLQRAQDARDESQLHQLRNTMLSAISHDYRTPLATILGAATSLQEQSARLSAPQQQRLLGTIVDEVQQLNQLTENTLQLVRLDAIAARGGVSLQGDWESAEDIVGSVAQRLRLRQPQARLSVRVEPNLPLLRCDAVLLVQLLNNLVDNALKYAPSTAPIELEVRRLESQILLSVGDRGPGVPPQWRERIFEVFQRGQVQPKVAGVDRRSQRGAGVGLAVCRAIAQAHGGTLTVRARQRGGACFECRLPIHAQPTLEGAAPARPAGETL
jgi:two-component system sensor histidine kinase KdpD